MSLKWLLLTYALPIALVFHVVRTGRNNYWIFILLMIPGLGCLAYIAVEILPELFSGRGAQAVNRSVKMALNPNKELKDAKRALEIAPTVSNRVRYARLLLDRKSYDEAIGVLKPALTNFFVDDPAVLEGLAVATFAKKDYAQALSYVELIMANKEWPVKPQIELLRARIHEIQGEPGPAEQLFSRLAKTSSGEEAKLAYGQFLVRKNRAAEARPIFEDIVKRSKYMSAHGRKLEDEWIRLAQRELSRL